MNNLNSPNIKVSVLVLCFRHAKYLKQCLDSILSQKTDFDFEIIIGDDASDDDSPSIIKEYQENNPDKISQVFLHQQNFGDFGRTNALIIQKAAKAPYVIIIEGDDYWTDDTKLARQAKVLDENTETVICFHNALVQYDDEPQESHLLNNFKQEIFSLDDLIGEDEIWFMATASVMFRNIFINDAPAWFFRSKSGDIPTYILLAQHGNIRYIDRTMSVYRKHFGGQSYSDVKQDAIFLQNRIEMYENIDKHLAFKYHHKLIKNIARYYLMLANSVQYGDSFFQSRFFALKYLILARPDFEVQKKVFAEYIVPIRIMHLYAPLKWKIMEFLKFKKR